MTGLIGYARVSTRQQSTDRQQVVLLAAGGIRRDDLYIDRGALGARVSRPHFDRPLRALIDGDNLVMRRWIGSGDTPWTCSPSLTDCTAKVRADAS